MQARPLALLVHNPIKTAAKILSQDDIAQAIS